MYLGWSGPSSQRTKLWSGCGVFHSAGLPLSARSDSGGSFRSRFSEIGIEHTLTSPYNSPSNGGCERSVKHVLQIDGRRKITQEILNKINFGINCQVQDEEVGSAAEHFYRAPRSYLPNSINHFVDHQQFIERRKQKQIEVSRRKGRSSPTDFEPGDKVVIQDHLSKCWNMPGVITEKHVAEDGTSKSFLVEKSDGRVVIRNARFFWNTRGKNQEVCELADSYISSWGSRPQQWIVWLFTSFRHSACQSMVDKPNQTKVCWCYFQ